jgi:pilus assembly protein CpaC
MKTIGKSIRSGGCLLLSVLCVMLLCDSAGMFAANPNIVKSQRECMTIVVGQSKIVKAPWPAIRVSVTDPKVANVQILTPDQILVQANKVGSTDLILWNKDETTVWQSCVYVSLDIEQYQQKLYAMFPHASLQLDQSGDVLIIKGLLRSADEAVQLHKYLEKTGTAYVDMTSVAGTQQVQLEVRVAEVSRTAIRALGFNIFNAGSDNFFGNYSLGVQPGTSSGGALVTGQGLNLATPSSVSPASVTAPAAVTVFAGFGNDWRAFIQALAENQYLRVLANPTLVALSGEEASFLAGGEFPIPVVQSGTSGAGGGTSISIEYKEYGVRLSFRPIVLGDGTIRLYAAPEVSDLTTLGAVTISGFEVPALKTRKFETTLELKSGQTFAMAGLIKKNDDAITSGVPGLGDLPVLGALFRSVRYTRGETEMVVLVTATLVEPLNLAKAPPLPGFLDEEPSDWELYVDGRIEGKGPAKINSTDANWLREMGIDKLIGPGAWDTYENPAARSKAEPK